MRRQYQVLDPIFYRESFPGVARLTCFFRASRTDIQSIGIFGGKNPAISQIA